MLIYTGKNSPCEFLALSLTIHSLSQSFFIQAIEDFKEGLQQRKQNLYIYIYSEMIRAIKAAV